MLLLIRYSYFKFNNNNIILFKAHAITCEGIHQEIYVLTNEGEEIDGATMQQITEQLADSTNDGPIVVQVCFFF